MSAGLKGILGIKDLDIEGKRVFLRLDLNVPVNKQGEITDSTRLKAALPTIAYALEKGAKLVLASHFGRPKKGFEKEYSLEPVAKALAQELNLEVILEEEPDSDAVNEHLKTLKKNQVVMLENLRFHEGETANSQAFAQVLSDMCDVYINDAFGASHRKHASIYALPELVQKKAVGFLMTQEVNMLDKLLSDPPPSRPFVAVLGGSKVSDKIGIIEKLLDLVDAFVIGGAMAYTFLKAAGKPVGLSLVEGDKLKFTKELMERIEARGKTLLLPVDHVVASGIQDKEGANFEIIPQDKMGVDIGPKTILNYTGLLKEAGTVFWNGPMGVFENPAFSQGTFAIARCLGECSESVFRVVGGGDSVAAVQAAGFAHKMSHISTGGGASLEYLQGDKLPGLEVLKVKKSGV